MVNRWVIIAAAWAVLGLAVAGCGAAVDADGNVIPDKVWFDQTGAAHCPRCDPELKLVVPPDAPPSEVKRHSNVCAQDARHPVKWAADEVVCAKCSGMGTCPDCRGSGVASAGGRACGGCVEPLPDDDAKGTGTGRCALCKGSGLVRYGG